jgi:HEAT repeat protein
MKEKIDWKALALQLNVAKEEGQIISTRHARQALELLLSEENMREAVDYYITGRPGSELARLVLMLILPWSAMKYCYDIYSSQRPLKARRLAVELLRAIADERALDWVDEFLGDEDSEVQLWGASLLEQLIYKGFVEIDNAEPFIANAERHANPNVREQAVLIREFIG